MTQDVYNMTLSAEELANLPDLETSWEKYMQDVSRTFPQNNLRSSSIGTECDRYHFYSIKNWRERAAVEPVLQSVFLEGALHERATIQQLQNQGYEITDTQRDYQVDDPLITGHIDGRLRYKDQVYPFDVKSIKDTAWSKLITNNVGDLLNSKQSYRRRYVAQLQLYLHMTGNKIGVLVFKNKTTGQLKTIWMKYDANFVQELLDRAKRVYANIANNTPGLRTDDFTMCSDCEFKHICLPDIQNDPAKKLQFLHRQDLPAMFDRLTILEANRDEYEELDSQLNQIRDILGPGDYICGDWILTVQAYKRNVKGESKTYLKKTFTKLTVTNEGKTQNETTLA